ncbi:MAG: hypothetical protein KY468_09515 [Armatimonadetes bacterium]|nr:hypothetical protein [Armatimonadota bacterium]
MRRSLASLILFGVILSLAGCSNNPYPPGQAARPVIYRTMPEDPRSLDPSFAYTVSEAQIVDLIYPSFYRYHYLKRDPFVLELNLGAEEPKREPHVVTEVEKGRKIQKTGEAWTFRIKPGIRFQDDPCFPGGKGREVKAADFLFSFRRIADPSVHSPVLGFFADKILGFHEYAERNSELLKKGKLADYSAPVEGLQLDPNDPYTFRILLNQPYPQLRYLMAMHFTTPQAHEAVKKYGDELARHPVGCGPYVLAEFIPKQRIVLKANPNRYPEYYPTEGEPGDREKGLLKDAGKRLPLNEMIVYSTVKEGITGWNLFLQGYLDAWGVTQENYTQVMSRQGSLSGEMKRKGVRLDRSVGATIGYFAFNMDDPVFGGYTPQKRKLRQAISLAVDSQAFIDLFNQGLGENADFLIPPGIYGYEPGYQNPYRQHNPEKAKALLAEAGYPNGIDPKSGERLTLIHDNTATNAAGRQFVGLLKKQIEAIGVRYVSRSWRRPVWEGRVDEGKFQFIAYGWLADYPDPENFVFLLYGPNGRVNGRSGVNSSNYNNPEYNRLFEQMRAMEDGPERLALIRKMRDIAVEDSPWIYRDHDESLGLMYNWLQNVKTHSVANDTSKYLSVDGPYRVEKQLDWNRPNYLPLAGGVAFLVLGSIPAAEVVRRRRRRKLRRNRPEVNP